MVPPRRFSMFEEPGTPDYRLGLQPRTTSFTRLSHGWNAEPNAPEPEVSVMNGELVLTFAPKPFQHQAFYEHERVRLVFVGAWRYRMGSIDDEGWYRGRCRFSGIDRGTSCSTCATRSSSATHWTGVSNAARW